MGLTMNVLLSINVFLLLVSKILPPTSLSIPLVAKYLLLTFVLNIITILITVVICNIYFRSPITHRLPPWVRSVFLDWLPLLMCMQRPGRKDVLHQKKKKLETKSSQHLTTPNHHPHCKVADTVRDGAPLIRISHPSCEDLSPDAQRAVDAIEFITENMKDDETTKQYRDDWKYIAMVVDRILLYGFFGITLGGTIDSIAGMMSDAEDRLMVDLFRGYNSLVQPVRNKTELPMIIKIAMQLVLLINVDEKEQVMHTNVWLTLRWQDFQMRWDPKDYDGITQIRVAPDKIWLPDIVLFNNADGNYEVSFMCNALIHHSGEVLWVPPAIYKSSCIIDVEFFPFDDQRCSLTFGSWTVSFALLHSNSSSKLSVAVLILPLFQKGKISRVNFFVKVTMNLSDMA
ncbi:unnamed protein product [Haemonchus placei]|uniref:Neur_chan_LBD domain-containing protein n=1 Tax=Haemonchus placei TaxID=6290 RepID=A0A0N4X6K6_HAEPC|nr:unnamed protein product [Haemonchus placei]